jgi:hypothetical protein
MPLRHYNDDFPAILFEAVQKHGPAVAIASDLDSHHLNSCGIHSDILVIVAFGFKLPLH